MRNRWLAAPALAAAAVLLAACGSHTSDPPTTGSASTTASHAGTVKIRVKHTSRGAVLATAGGRTIYWFSKDTKTASNCNGSCASYWPPVLGKPVAAAGASLPMGFGTIKRADGEVQATYDGHPLYTYTGDTSTSMVSGNDTDLSGGWWWAATPSGSLLGKSSSPSSASSPKASPSSSTSSGSGGSGW